jgi:universal stress protein E
LFSNTDWHLIRNCNIPLWLVKAGEPAKCPRIIAAEDPLHDHDKPAELDHKILTFAAALANRVSGRLDVLHAFDPSPAYAVSADSMAFPISAPINELMDALRQRHADAMADLLKHHTVDADAVHTLEGDTREVLTGFAEECAADLLVMGAVSRSAVKRLFLGSTAEQLLDRIPCDLLIVKPNATPRGD